MPCMDWEPSRVERVEDTTKVDKLTELLCEACNLLENTGYIEDGSKELQKWSKAHQKVDVLRLETELKQAQLEAKKKWLAGLTPRERKLMEGK